MVVTVRDASEAYASFYGFDKDSLSDTTFYIDDDHDLDHLMAGRVPDYMACGMSLSEAVQAAHDNHLEDFVWFKAELLSAVYSASVCSKKEIELPNIGIGLVEYSRNISRLFNMLDKKNIKTPYSELRAVIDRDIARNDTEQLTNEEIAFHYARAIRIREAYQAQKHKFGDDIMGHSIIAFADPEFHLEHKPTPLYENGFDFN